MFEMDTESANFQYLPRQVIPILQMKNVKLREVT